MMTSPQLGHLTNNYRFISTSISSNATKIRKIVDQHAQMLRYKYDEVNTTRSHDQRLRFISSSIKSVTTKLQMKQNQHALILPS